MKWERVVKGILLRDSLGPGEQNAPEKKPNDEPLTSDFFGYMAVKTKFRKSKLLRTVDEEDEEDEESSDADFMRTETVNMYASFPGHDTLFVTGQHKGLSYARVVRIHPDYVMWGRITIRAERDPPSIRGSASSSSGAERQKPPNPPPEKRCEHGCHFFTRAGSSARFIRKTCRQCGHSTQEERYNKQFDPKYCLHDAIDHRGSTSKLARSCCAKCLTYVDEHPGA
eukprot:7296821-Pyramimonas_sp.AAC.1